MTSRTVSKGSRRAYVQIRVPPEMPCLHPTMSVSRIKTHVLWQRDSFPVFLFQWRGTKATDDRVKSLSSNLCRLWALKCRSQEGGHFCISGSKYRIFIDSEALVHTHMLSILWLCIDHCTDVTQIIREVCLKSSLKCIHRRIQVWGVFDDLEMFLFSYY